MAEIKISDEAFLSILRENGGLYAVTAKAIDDQLGIKLSRQAVRQRAMDHPEELKDIEEEQSDIAEEGLQSLMKSTDDKIKIDAIKFYLKTKGKKRGYVERVENAVTDNDGNNIQPIININVIRTKKDTDDSL
jgi:hypothetical protein